MCDTGTAVATRPATSQGMPIGIARNATAGAASFGRREKSGQRASLKRCVLRAARTASGATISSGGPFRPRTFSTRKGRDATWSMCACVTRTAGTRACSSSVSASVTEPASTQTLPFTRNDVWRWKGEEPPWAPRTRTRTAADYAAVATDRGPQGRRREPSHASAPDGAFPRLLPSERRPDVERGLRARQVRPEVPLPREIHVPREAEKIDAEAGAVGCEPVLQPPGLPELNRLVVEPRAADVHENVSADASERQDRRREEVHEGKAELRVHVEHVVPDDAPVVVAAQRVEAAEIEDRGRRAARNTAEGADREEHAPRKRQIDPALGEDVGREARLARLERRRVLQVDVKPLAALRPEAGVTRLVVREPDARGRHVVRARVVRDLLRPVGVGEDQRDVESTAQEADVSLQARVTRDRVITVHREAGVPRD